MQANITNHKFDSRGNECSSTRRQSAGKADEPIVDTWLAYSDTVQWCGDFHLKWVKEATMHATQISYDLCCVVKRYSSTSDLQVWDLHFPAKSKTDATLKTADENHLSMSCMCLSICIEAVTLGFMLCLQFCCSLIPPAIPNFINYGSVFVKTGTRRWLGKKAAIAMHSEGRCLTDSEGSWEV